MKLTTAQVQRFLESLGGGAIRDVRPVGQGEWSQAYFYREVGDREAKSGDVSSCREVGDAGVWKVVRFSEIDEDFRRDQFAAGFASAGLPIPRVEAIGEAFGGYYAISKRVTGRMIDDLNAPAMRRIVPAVLDLLDSLRLADTSKTTGFGGWDVHGNGTSASWRGSLLDVVNDYPGGRVSGWRAKIAANPLAEEAFTRAYQRLAADIAACPEERHVIHSDLLHFNVLVDLDPLTQRETITAVIDWGCAMYGDWLYDLAWFVFFQPWYQAMSGIDFPAELARRSAEAGVTIPSFAERLRCCQLHIGLGNLEYSAFRDNWTDGEAIARRLLELV